MPKWYPDYRQARRLDQHGRLRQGAGHLPRKAGGTRRNAGPHGHRGAAGLCGAGHPRRWSSQRTARRNMWPVCGWASVTDTQDVTGTTAGDPSRHGGSGSTWKRLLPRFLGEHVTRSPHVLRRQDRRAEALRPGPEGTGGGTEAPAASPSTSWSYWSRTSATDYLLRCRLLQGHLHPHPLP